MYHALRLEEILLNIFCHCLPTDYFWTAERRQATASLAALARTCRTFKKPALDVLWSELVDLSPLAFCLPDVHQASSNCYSFASPRSDTQWNTLRSYTQRVRRIVSFWSPDGCLDPECISATFNLSLPCPLFPNLRHLAWQGGTAALPAMHFAVPSLTSLDIRCSLSDDDSLYISLLDTLVPRCPNIKDIRVRVAGTDLGRVISRHLRSWPMLHTVDLLDVPLPTDVIPHLARIPTLTRMAFSLPHFSLPTLAHNSIHVFSQLAYLEITSQSLEAVTNLVRHLRFPAVQTFNVSLFTSPLKETVRTYFSTINDICASDTLMHLQLFKLCYLVGIPNAVSHPLSRDDWLTYDVIRPCMVFHNLRGLHINLALSVDLTDHDVLALVTAWPHIERLIINDQWGWRTDAGITLHGLSRVLHTCRGLRDLCMAVDTRSAVACTPGWATGFTLPSLFRRMDVADSPVRPGTASAVRAGLVALGITSGHLSAWCGCEMCDAHECKPVWMGLLD